MNLLDLMEETAEVLSPNRPPVVCRCPNYYYPTMYVNSHVREDVLALLEARNFMKLAELGVRFYNAADKKWYTWTTKLYTDFIATAKPFPKCNRSMGERDP